jgi:hypothetical protein
LVVFSLQLRGFTNSEMRVLLAQLLGLRSSQLSRRKTDLRPSPAPPPRHHRAHSAQPSIPTHTRWPAHRAVLLQDLCPPAPAQTRSDHARAPP